MGYEQLIVPVCRIGICGLIVYMTYIFFHSIFDARSKSKLFICIYLLAPCIMFYINTFENSVVNLVTVPLLLLFLVCITFRISFNNAVSYTIIFTVVFTGGKEVAFVLLNRFLQSLFPEFYGILEGPDGIYILVIEQLIGLLILLFTIRYTRKLKINNDTHFSRYLLIIPAASMSILSSFLYMDFPTDRYIQVLMCGGGFLLYFSNIAVFIILIKYAYILDQIKYAEMCMLKSDLEMENFRKLEKLNDRNRNFIHDSHTFNSNIRMLAMKGETEKIVEIVDELEGKMYKEVSDAIYSHNTVLNAILSERVAKCEEKKVKLTIFVEPYLKFHFIKASDMISLFGNLLDNAIEAASECDPGEREMAVRIFMGSDFMLILYIENSFVATKRKGKRFLTTKKDKSVHGLGIGICEMLAERYGGTLELKECDKAFTTILTLSTVHPWSN